MNLLARVFASLVLCCAVGYTQDDITDTVRRIADVVSAKCKEIDPDIKISIWRDGAIIADWHVRNYTVHSETAKGDWSLATETVVGPNLEGFRYYVYIGAAPYPGSMLRNGALEFDAGKARRLPYFFESYSLLSWTNLYMAVNFSFGEMADKKKAKQVYEVFEKAMRDLGEANK